MPAPAPATRLIRAPASPTSPRRQLIVNADDFGRSSSINAAVIQAHRHGILTTASLMVNEPGVDEAVKLARENPSLGVGLHLALLCGRSALSPQRIPGLVNSRAEFTSNPVAAGMRYFFNRSLRSQLRSEIHEQFNRFRATGLVLDHVNGHLHMHLHPVVLDILLADARELGIRHMRLTRDPVQLNLRLARGQWLSRVFHGVVYRWLSNRARPRFLRLGIRHTDAVFGLLQNARVDAPYILNLLPCLPPGDSELYSHPSGDEFKHELDALIDPAVQERVRALGIKLIRYQDL